MITPPVVETILGVQFDPILSLTNSHFGLFWQSLGVGWPDLRETTLLSPEFERFNGGRWMKLGVQLRLSDNPACRVQIRNETEDRMIQIQHDRFHFNWLGEATHPYPRYCTIRQEFQSHLNQFLRFLNEHHLGSLRPTQWEITYINHIPKNTLWSKPTEWGFCRLLGNLQPIDPETAVFESFSGSWHYVIPPKRGRLHVHWQHAREDAPDPREIIRLNLTARGDVANNDAAEVLAGLNAGHDAIVLGFKAIMTEDANRHWGHKNA